MKTSSCPKCDSEMVAGLLVDAAYGGPRKGTWIKGEDLPMIKINLLPPSVEVTGERYTLTMFRCVSCGFVETYAKDEA